MTDRRVLIEMRGSDMAKAPGSGTNKPFPHHNARARKARVYHDVSVTILARKKGMPSCLPPHLSAA